ncbi:hypothetical protein [Methylobacterium komagatae]|uniref:hypothetical protein n=1 Tax=Methylobacterium komagatae TaxID=374425 RepID=UPI00366E035F
MLPIFRSLAICLTLLTTKLGEICAMDGGGIRQSALNHGRVGLAERAGVKLFYEGCPILRS